MVCAARLRFMDDEELIREYRASDNPILQKLARRLEAVIDESNEEIKELKQEASYLENSDCADCERHETKIDRLIAKIEYALAKAGGEA